MEGGRLPWLRPAIEPQGLVIGAPLGGIAQSLEGGADLRSVGHGARLEHAHVARERLRNLLLARCRG